MAHPAKVGMSEGASDDRYRPDRSVTIIEHPCAAGEKSAPWHDRGYRWGKSLWSYQVDTSSAMALSCTYSVLRTHTGYAISRSLFQPPVCRQPLTIPSTSVCCCCPPTLSDSSNSGTTVTRIRALVGTTRQKRKSRRDLSSLLPDHLGCRIDNYGACPVAQGWCPETQTGVKPGPGI